MKGDTHAKKRNLQAQGPLFGHAQPDHPARRAACSGRPRADVRLPRAGGRLGGLRVQGRGRHVDADGRPYGPVQLARQPAAGEDGTDGAGAAGRYLPVRRLGGLGVLARGAEGRGRGAGAQDTGASTWRWHDIGGGLQAVHRAIDGPGEELDTAGVGCPGHGAGQRQPTADLHGGRRDPVPRLHDRHAGRPLQLRLALYGRRRHVAAASNGNAPAVGVRERDRYGRDGARPRACPPKG